MSAPGSGDAVSLSAIDEARFGVVTARAAGVTAAGLPAVLAFCRDQAVQLLIARCAAGDLAAAQAVEGAGGRLMDTLVYYARSLELALPELPGTVAIRPAGPDDAAAVREVARDAFQGYFGHYHQDHRLDRAACDETYSDWAYQSCWSPRVADEVLLAELEGQVVGFLTTRAAGPGRVEVPLNGVLRAAQRGGVYRQLLLEALRRARARGATALEISTQLTNVPVQKAWVRLGLEPTHAEYTFHLWFTGG